MKGDVLLTKVFKVKKESKQSTKSFFPTVYTLKTGSEISSETLVNIYQHGVVSQNVWTFNK
jgi:hypothetical protein